MDKVDVAPPPPHRHTAPHTAPHRPAPNQDKLSDCGEDAPLVQRRPFRMRGLGSLGDFSLVPILTDDVDRVRIDPNASLLDLRAVAAYVLALQCVGACIVVTAISVVVPHALPSEGRTNAMRNLVLSSLVATLLLARPALALHDEHVSTQGPPLRYLFKSLRACAAFVLLMLACEALVFSECENTDAHAIHSLRHALLVLAFLGIKLASCFRAAYPTSTSDVHVAISLVCLTLLACTPQSQSHLRNPLTRPLPFVDGLVRLIRVALFSTTYSACALAAAPERIFELEPLVLSMRAFAATAWIMACPPQLLFAQPLFMAVLCWRRVKLDAKGGGGGGPPVVAGTYFTGDSDDVEIQETMPHAPPYTTKPGTTTQTKTSTISEERKRVLLSRLSGGDV